MTDLDRDTRTNAGCNWLGAALAAAPLAAAVLVGARAFELGVAGEWTWRWQQQPMWDRAWLPASFFLILGAVLAAGYSRAAAMRVRDEVAVVVLASALCMVVQLSLAFLGKGGGQDVVFATTTRWVGGYFDAARRDVGGSVGAFLKGYPEYIRSLPMDGPMIHVGQHPPGGVLFYWLQLRLFESCPLLRAAALRAGQWFAVGGADAVKLGMVSLKPFEQATVWSSFFLLSAGVGLTVAPVYVLGRWLGGAKAGLLAVGLYAATPSVHLFSPHVDQLHLPLSAFASVLWAWSLRGRRWWASAAAGVWLGACLFVSVHFLALGAVFACTAVLWAWRGEQHWRVRLRAGAWPCVWLGAGLCVVVVAQYVCWSHNALRVWWVCLSKHEAFYEHFPRSYGKWVWANLLEFGLFAGAASSLGWCVWTVRAVGGWRRGWDVVSALALASAGVLLGLNFSGANLSEVARLWMFLMPVAAAAAGAEVAGLGGWWWAVIASQFVQVVVFKLRLDVFSLY